MSNYTPKKLLLSKLIAIHRDAAGWGYGKSSADTASAYIVTSPDDLAQAHMCISPPCDLPPPLLSALGLAVATLRGSHYARSPDGTIDREHYRLAHRYTADELWLLQGSGLPSLYAERDKLRHVNRDSHDEFLRDRDNIRKRQRQLISIAPDTVRAMTVLRILLLWRCAISRASILTRDGAHVVATLTERAHASNLNSDDQPSRITITGDVEWGGPDVPF